MGGTAALEAPANLKLADSRKRWESPRLWLFLIQTLSWDSNSNCRRRRRALEASPEEASPASRTGPSTRPPIRALASGTAPQLCRDPLIEFPLLGGAPGPSPRFTPNWPSHPISPHVSSVQRLRCSGNVSGRGEGSFRSTSTRSSGRAAPIHAAPIHAAPTTRSVAVDAGRCFRFEGAHKLRPVCRHRCNAKHCCSQA